jgi:type II secretory pathway predicted ATPase ExeA
MFLDFYQMEEQPFGVTPDPRFLYLGKSHREALASLHYGIECNRGFIALIAPPGLGKTTLTYQVIEKLQRDTRTVFLFQSQCNSREFFQQLLNGLGVDAEGMDLVSMHNKLNQILCRELLAGCRFVLAIDEAQNLDREVLESIRLLSNFETSKSKLLQILLIGQSQLARKLASPELEQLHQRISMFARLEPFGFEDTVRYITHRLRVAGYNGEPLFSPGALRLIAEKSQGIPRKINGLCFNALSLGCAMSRKQVDVGLMEEVLADHDAESISLPKVVRHASRPPLPARPAVTSPGLKRPTLTSYPVKQEKKFGGWEMRAVGTVALVAIMIGILSLTPAIRSGALRIAGLAIAKSDSANVQAAELPSAESSKSLSPSGDSEINSVIVQPGETLREIILRTTGYYNADVVERVRKLNPAISDLDHLEAGQEIRFPLIPRSQDSATASGEAGAEANNRTTDRQQ